MGHCFSKYIIWSRGGVYYVKETDKNLDTGPFIKLNDAKKFIKELTYCEDYNNNPLIIAKYDANGNEI